MHAELYRILAYVWAAFGTYWIGASMFQRSPKSESPRKPPRWLQVGFLLVTLGLLFVGRHAIPPAIFIVLALAWTALGLYWRASGATSQSGEFRFYRPMRLVILAVTFSLLFWSRTGVGFLGKRFVPDSPVIAITSLIATLAGLAVALWARLHLGRFWSDKVVLQADHRLVRSGPYASMRHPIYTGVLLAVAATALASAEIRGLLAFCILLANYSIKARKEEKLLAQQFGEEFREHQKHAGFLLPRFR